MSDRVIGIFASDEAAGQALQDLRQAGFSPAPQGEQSPGVRDLEREGRTAVVVDPQGREPEARAIMMRAGVERIVDQVEEQRTDAADAGDERMRQEQRAGVAAPATVARPSPLTTRSAGSSEEQTGSRYQWRDPEERDEDTGKSVIRERAVHEGDPHLDDTIRRGATRGTI
jgi:hypothetical protein